LIAQASKNSSGKAWQSAACALLATDHPCQHKTSYSAAGLPSPCCTAPAVHALLLLLPVVTQGTRVSAWVLFSVTVC
jgi:hypothetical protein